MIGWRVYCPKQSLSKKISRHTPFSRKNRRSFAVSLFFGENKEFVKIVCFFPSFGTILKMASITCCLFFVCEITFVLKKTDAKSSCPCKGQKMGKRVFSNKKKQKFCPSDMTASQIDNNYARTHTQLFPEKANTIFCGFN